jgi:hypothetical protein
LACSYSLGAAGDNTTGADDDEANRCVSAYIEL